MRAGKHLVLYDDGDQEWLCLKAERIDWSQNEGRDPKEDAADEDAEVLLLDALSRQKRHFGFSQIS
jgi:hypothetical protein